MNFEIIGFIAGILTSISLFPQVVKSIRTRSTDDISLIWTSINITGQIAWIIYGIFIGSMSLYIMSGVSLTMVTTLTILKIRFDAGIPKGK